MSAPDADLPIGMITEPLFMDCVHVREGGPHEAYTFIDRPLARGRMVGCRVCDDCRQRIEDFLQAAPILGMRRPKGA